MAIRGGEQGGFCFEALPPCEFMKKKCTRCKEEKSLADFVKVATGRHSMCDPCRKEYNKEYQKKLTKLKGKKLW